jgi:hypothetical protein
MSQLKPDIPAGPRTNIWIPHGSHVMYGFRFFVNRTSRSSVQTGQGKAELPFKTDIVALVRIAYFPMVYSKPLFICGL